MSLRETYFQKIKETEITDIDKESLRGIYFQNWFQKLPQNNFFFIQFSFCKRIIKVPNTKGYSIQKGARYKREPSTNIVSV